MMSVSAGLHVGGGDWRGVMRERCDAGREDGGEQRMRRSNAEEKCYQ